MKLDKLKKEVADQPAKIEATTKESPIKEPITDIITENTKITKIETFEDVKKNLRDNFKLGEVYLFLDIHTNKYVVINYDSVDKYDYFTSFDKQSIKPYLKSVFKNRFKKGITQFFEFSDGNIKGLIGSIQGLKKGYHRNKEEFYEDSDYCDALNLFKQTDLLRYEPKATITYDELLNSLETKYKRFNLILNNNTTDSNGKKWFLDWVSMEMNDPTRIETAPIIIGFPGSGKTFIMETIFKENVYDFSNVAVLDNKTVNSNFNGIYNYKSFIIMNEISTSDLKENNQIAQDLKRMITDGTFVSQKKGQDQEERGKTFNIVMTTNDNKPVQMEADDRRYCVLGKGKALLQLEELKAMLIENNETFDEFMTLASSEIKKALYEIKALDYDNSVSKLTYMTDLKKSIIGETNTKQDLMKSFFFVDKGNSPQNYSDLYDVLKKFDFEDEEQFFITLRKQYEIGIFTNDILFELYITVYEIEVNDFNKSNIAKKSGAFWGKILEKPPKPQVKLNGTPTNLKAFSLNDWDMKLEKLKKLYKDIEQGKEIFFEPNLFNQEIETVYEEIEEDEEIPF